MKKIGIADTTLCRADGGFSFKEKLEIARQLERLNVDVIELPAIENTKTDILFVRTVSSFVKNSIISVEAGISADSIEQAAAALSAAAKPCIRIELPVSPVGMEYTCHKKAPKMLAWISEAVAMAKSKCNFVEFCATDATRAEPEFLRSAIKAAAEAGATVISVCDSAASMLPDDFAAFAAEVSKYTDLPLGVKCDNSNGLATAQAVLAVRAGVDTVKTDVGGNTAQLDVFADMIKNCGNSYGMYTDINITELHRTVKQIAWISNNSRSGRTVSSVSEEIGNGIHLDSSDDIAAVTAAIGKLGYELSDEDNAKVYEEFCRVAAKKTVGAKELDAIVASVALQVPSTYKLISYVINNGNIISTTAQLTLESDGVQHQGISIGDGPVDAAFLAIDQITGSHYELDDFQIQSVTEGKEAMGKALVKLRSGGKLYSGSGISTDIIGAAIRAYISAVNKIVYEEA